MIRLWPAKLGQINHLSRHEAGWCPDGVDDSLVDVAVVGQGIGSALYKNTKIIDIADVVQSIGTALHG